MFVYVYILKLIILFIISLGGNIRTTGSSNSLQLPQTASGKEIYILTYGGVCEYIHICIFLYTLPLTIYPYTPTARPNCRIRRMVNRPACYIGYK